MAITPIYQELTPVDLPLDSIYLDPNNPRFVEYNWTYVPDKDIEAAQDRTTDLLTQYFAIEKLRMNMEVNGFLPIDRVIVRSLAPNKYVTLEGNRRICAAKSLLLMSGNGLPIPQVIIDSLYSIPCLLYTGTEHDAAWILQGIRHITGIAEWSAFNKAKLLVEQMEEEGLNLTDVGKRFGLSAHGAGQWVRGYRAFQQALEKSDYIEEVTEKSYPYFQELFSRSSAPVREWLEWNESDYEFRNALNFNEFVGWLYPRDEEDSDTKGDWEKRRLARRDDLRTLAILLRDDLDAFNQFRQGTELEIAYSIAQTRKFEQEAKSKRDPVEDVFDSVKACSKALEDIPFRALKDPETKTRLISCLKPLMESINGILEPE